MTDLICILKSLTDLEEMGWGEANKETSGLSQGTGKRWWGSLVCSVGSGGRKAWKIKD